jgi:hypothetical protein
MKEKVVKLGIVLLVFLLGINLALAILSSYINITGTATVAEAPKWVQTDWSGGPSYPTWDPSNPNRYNSSSNINYSTSGEIRLAKTTPTTKLSFVTPTESGRESKDKSLASCDTKLNSNDGKYCGDDLSVDNGEWGYVNSTHSSNMPADATITNVTICLDFKLDTKWDDNTGDKVRIFVGENSTGSWTYTQVAICQASNCTPWETEATRCYDVTSIINTVSKAKNIRLSIYGNQDGDGKQDIFDDWNYVNITYTQPGVYFSSGELISSVFNSTFTPADWRLIRWNADIPTGTSSLTIQTRTGNTSTPDGTWSSFTNQSNDTDVTSPNSKYIQYKAILTTADVSKTPVLYDITIWYKQT